MPSGGYRPNAKGPKKGAKYKPTIAKEIERERFRAIFGPHMEQTTLAQIAIAQGVKYMVKRDKGGTFKAVTADAAKALSPEDVLELWDKMPNPQAYKDLMDRYIDKPAEQEQAIKVGGTLILKHEL